MNNGLGEDFDGTIAYRKNYTHIPIKDLLD